MTASQTCGCVYAIAGTVLVAQFLLMSVRGDGADSGEEELDFSYVFIGAGIGVFLAAMFVIYKVCLIRKQVLANRTLEETDVTIRRNSRRGLSS